MSFSAREITLSKGIKVIKALVADGTDPGRLIASELARLKGVLERLYREFDQGLNPYNRFTVAVLKAEYGLKDASRIRWRALVHDRLFLAYLEAVLNTDLVLEQVVVRVRKRLLLGDMTWAPVTVTAAVAHQCF